MLSTDETNNGNVMPDFSAGTPNSVVVGDELDDKWLFRGRSPVTAAIVALFGIGVAYIAAQMIFLIGGILVERNSRQIS